MRNILVHGHIFKNAGTTFDYLLKTTFGEAFVDHREDHLVRTDPTFVHRYCSQNPNIKAFSSHALVHRPLDSGEVRFFPVYFVRHPIERALSVYNFELKQPPSASLGASMAKKFTFEEYVKWRMQEGVPPSIRNQQVIYLAGKGQGDKAIELKFREAMGFVAQSPLIGLVDDFAASLSQINDALPTELRLDIGKIPMQNVAVQPNEGKTNATIRLVQQELSEEAYENLLESNKFDLRLYEEVRDRVSNVRR